MKLKDSLTCRALLIALLVPTSAFAVAGTGCKKQEAGAKEQDMRKAFNDRSGFDINKLTPSQRAGYEASMKGQGGPPPSAPKASSDAPASPAPAASPSR